LINLNSGAKTGFLSFGKWKEKEQTNPFGRD
jgi:hypothetical protein